MSIGKVSSGTQLEEIECVLSSSEIYIETLSIKPLETQPWIVELAIKTQLLSAKNPNEKRVKSKSYIERSRLIDLANAISKLQSSGWALDGGLAA